MSRDRKDQRSKKERIINMESVKRQELKMIHSLIDKDIGPGKRKKRRRNLRRKRMREGEIFLDKPRHSLFIIPQDIIKYGKRRYDLFMKGQFNDFKNFKRINFKEDGIIVSNKEWNIIKQIPENKKLVDEIERYYLGISKSKQKGLKKEIIPVIDTPKKRSIKKVVVIEKEKSVKTSVKTYKPLAGMKSNDTSPFIIRRKPNKDSVKNGE